MTAIFLTALLITAGTALFLMPYIPMFSKKIILLLDSNALFLSRIGLSFIFLGLLFAVCIYLFSKRRYLLIKMGGFSIQDSVINEIVKDSIQNLFPSQNFVCDVFVRKKSKVEILADLPYVSFEKQESILKDIESKVKNSLAKICGFDREFLLNVSFKEKKPSV